MRAKQPEDFSPIDITADSINSLDVFEITPETVTLNNQLAVFIPVHFYDPHPART
jgi:hypothetical protein